MTTDEMKLQRDGQLAYGTPRPAPTGPLHRVVKVTETSVFTTLGDGRGVIEWAR